MSNFKKIVLFNPKPTKNEYFSSVPLALLSIVSLVDRKKYDIKIIVARKDKDYKKEILKETKNALCFGITCITGYPIKEAIFFSKLVKKNYPHAKIIWGGWHPSLKPFQTISNPFIDIVIQGQGEKTFAEVIERLAKKKSLKGIKGVIFKDAKKRIIQNPPRNFEDVNKFPTMPYEAIDIGKLIQITELGDKTINYLSSRGCPYSCRFCPENKISKKKWYSLKSERVVEEIIRLVEKYNINGIIFNDNNFFLDEKRVKNICKGFIQNKLKIKWGDANGRVDNLLKYSKETWKLMKASGCYRILIGAESGYKEALKLINKNLRVDEIIELTKICNEYGIRITFSMMIGLPFPELAYTKKDKIIEKEFQQTTKLIKQIQKISSINHHFLLFTYTPYPSTPLYDACLNCGFKEPKSLEEWSNFELNMHTSPWIPIKYEKVTAQLTEYIFPFLSNIYYQRIKRKHPLGAQVYKLLGHIAKIRWKTQFFYFPLDYWLFRKIIKLYNR